MKLVQVYFNDQYIEVTSWNDGGVYIFNYDFQPIVLDKIIKNEDLGRAIKIALESSHNIAPDLVKEILFSPLVKQKKQDRQNELMKKFNYRSKKSFFKNMRNISIELQDNYNISPSHQDGLDYSFTGLSKADEIILPCNATDEELGQAVRLAYEKCTSIY